MCCALSRRTLGYYRFEILAAALNAALLFIHRTVHPIRSPQTGAQSHEVPITGSVLHWCCTANEKRQQSVPAHEPCNGTDARRLRSFARTVDNRETQNSVLETA